MKTWSVLEVSLSNIKILPWKHSWLTNHSFLENSTMQINSKKKLPQLLESPLPLQLFLSNRQLPQAGQLTLVDWTIKLRRRKGHRAEHYLQKSTWFQHRDRLKIKRYSSNTQGFKRNTVLLALLSLKMIKNAAILFSKTREPSL